MKAPSRQAVAAAALRGSVVVYSAADAEARNEHEIASRCEIARRLAHLKGFDFAGEFDPQHVYPGAVYVVPDDTIVGSDSAATLGVSCAGDLFGGVVASAYQATKAITHPLVDGGPHAPNDWPREFADQVCEVVPAGFTAFALDDAEKAGECLLSSGPVRLKPVRGRGGRGQVVVSNHSELVQALQSLDAGEVSDYGLVLEENLDEVVTYSAGKVQVGALTASYCGTQRLTAAHDNVMVYGGSALLFARGDFDALLGLDLSADYRLAVNQARAYDAAADRCLPGFFASRRNYDIAVGTDAHGRRRSGVLEQSWRLGGASSAEVAAMEAFTASPGLAAARSACVESYGECEEPPGNATIYYRGTDAQAGYIIKYAVLGALDEQ